MIMAVEIRGVAGDAFAAASDGREDEAAIACGVMAGGAASGGMGLAGPDKRCDGSSVASDTVCGVRGDGHVCPDLSAVAVVMVVKVAGMTFDTGAASAAIDRGIAVTVYANDQGPVDTGVALEAVVFVDSADGVTRMAVDAEGGVGDRGRVVSAVAGAPGEIVAAMTIGTCTFGDGDHPGPVDGILEHCRVDGADVAIAALVGMDGHRVACRVTADTEGCIPDGVKAGGGVVNVEVGGRRSLVLMAIQTVHRALVRAVVGDDHLDGRVGFVMAGAATIDTNGVLGQNLGKVADHMAVCAGFRVNLTEVGQRVDLDAVVEGSAS